MVLDNITDAHFVVQPGLGMVLDMVVDNITDAHLDVQPGLGMVMNVLPPPITTTPVLMWSQGGRRTSCMCVFFFFVVVVFVFVFLCVWSDLPSQQVCHIVAPHLAARRLNTATTVSSPW